MSTARPSKRCILANPKRLFSTSVEQLLSLKPGDFIELDLKKSIEAKVMGVPVFDCHYGTSNGKYSLKVDHMHAAPGKGWLGENNVS